MKILLSFICIFTALNASAQNQDWFCKRESSQVYEDTVEACGAAIGRTEGQARRVSLAAAIAEFHDLCSISEHCKNRKYDAFPERTECIKTKTGFKCWRQITVHLMKDGS